MNPTESQPQDSTQLQQKWVLKAGTAATSVGLLVAVLVPILSIPNVNWLQSAALAVYMLASMAVSSIVGFVFGVPRARVEQASELGSSASKKRDARTVRFEANSNLEQISDWLTKILVGAGLVQLASLPAFLRSIGAYLGADFGPTGPPVALAFVLYGVGIGFLVSYLWTRLTFRVILETTEREAQQQSRAEKISQNIAEAEKSVSSAEGASTSATVIDAIASEADRISRGVTRFAPVLWVDDHPENNLELIRALEETGVRVDLAVSTDQAIRKLSERNYGVVITDAGRDEGGTDNADAGLDLLRKMQTMSPRPSAIVYTGYRGMSNAETLRMAGATEVTMSPAKLYQSTIHALVGAS